MKTKINVFDLAGSLLTTITNPTPANNDYFACAMTSVTNQLLIGANMDDSGATNAGIVYFFTVGEVSPAVPWLSITLDPQLSTIHVSWLSPSANRQLQQDTNSLISTNWMARTKRSTPPARFSMSAAARRSSTPGLGRISRIRQISGQAKL